MCEERYSVSLFP